MNEEYTKEKVIFHLHDDTSNCDGYFDSCTSFKDYIELAKRDGDKAIAFSNHGGIYDWIKKKQACDKAGLKYIHGVELYMCDKLSDNDRGYHIGLYSANYDGVLELNTLLSMSKSKGVKEDLSDRHSYFNPRLSLEEVMNTSDNIIVTTACIQSILYKYELYSKNALKLKYENIKISPAERARINKIKLESLDEEQSKICKKLKKDKKTEFMSNIKIDYDVISKYYLDTRDKFLNWLIENKHRCFLEVQAHSFEAQLEFTKMVQKWSNEYGIRMIAGTDTHSSTEYKAECRKIVQVAKDSYYGDEDTCTLLWQTYDEIFDLFKLQGILTDKEIEDAIHSTVELSDMVEEFKLNYDFKYPTLYGDNANGLFKNRIESMFKYKLDNGIIDNKRYQEYRDKIDEEFEVFTKQGMESFLLFMSELLQWCWEQGIPYGDRGSVTGSTIAYIINITDTDPVIWKTVFSRFCNVDRISLGDIDCDFAPEDRVRVYEYIIKRFTKEKTAFILTLGTLNARGTIDVLSKGLDGSNNNLELVKEIKNQYDKFHDGYTSIIQEEVNLEDLDDSESEISKIDFIHHDIYIKKMRNKNAIKNLTAIKDKWDKLKDDNKDLFYYFDGIKGSIISKGRHAAGIIGSPITLKDHLGVHYKDGDESQPISSCSMKAVDSLNYVKFDILGLNTLGIIKDCYEYMGVPWKKSHEINWNNDLVWDNMIKSNVGVFQFESDFSFGLLKTFEPKTITHMSMINAALRPSGKSYRERLIDGEININPSEEIDNLLKDNNGFLIFQEDTIKFLTDICGFDGGTADTIRRCIGKKDAETLKSYIPQMLDGYCAHSPKPRNIAEEEAKQFLQIISDSSEYQFGYNHSTGYSMNGYRCIDIRTSDPIIFTTAYLNRAMNKDDIINGTGLAKQYGYNIKPVRFRKSFSKYNYDEELGDIYKGTRSIKHIGNKTGDELYILRDNKYSSFIDLLLDIHKNTSVNLGQIKKLIELDFFLEFGKAKKLYLIAELFEVWGKKSTAKFFNKTKGIVVKLQFDEDIIKKHSSKKTECQYSGVDFASVIKDSELNMPNIDFKVKKKLEKQEEYLGYINYTNDLIPIRYVMVSNLDKTYSPVADMYALKNGKTIRCKMPKRGFDKTIDNGTILYVKSMKEKPVCNYIGNDENGKPQFEKNYDVPKVWWIEDYSVCNNIDAVIENLEGELNDK